MLEVILSIKFLQYLINFYNMQCMIFMFNAVLSVIPDKFPPLFVTSSLCLLYYFFL
jgi:hypothetical protein